MKKQGNALVILESPAKCSKINSILGPGYVVDASMGHLLKLTTNKWKTWFEKHRESGYDPETIAYEPDPEKKSQIAKLKREAKKASMIIIASDMDREGEAIGYHVKHIIDPHNKKPTQRILFDQITKEAILKAVKNPSEMRESLYRAQQARCVIDLLFGFTISPLLYIIAPKLSAGRCQSPTLRWLWQRQNEFLSFDSQDKSSFDLKGLLKSPVKDKESNTNEISVFAKKDSKENIEGDFAKDKLKIYETIREWELSAITQRNVNQTPPTPFTTSSLQQTCYSRWKWKPKRTMSLAQQLYEGGYITYMRTDCKTLSNTFIKSATSYLKETFGDNYLNVDQAVGTTLKQSKAKKNKTKKQANAQEAHEPIRPVEANVTNIPASNKAGPDGCKLYMLIHQTALSSLMTPCVQTKCSLEFKNISEKDSTIDEKLYSEWIGVHFPGFRIWEFLTLPFTIEHVKAFSKQFKPQKCPFKTGLIFKSLEYTAIEKHPNPPKPYSYSELIKQLEQKGVGRPSTYSSIIEKLETRKYTETEKSSWDQDLSDKKSKDSLHITINMRPKTPKWDEKTTKKDPSNDVKDRFHVSSLGGHVTEFLIKYFEDLIHHTFTHDLENQLDEIVKGTKTYQEVVGNFDKVLRQKIKSLPEEVLKQSGKPIKRTGSQFQTFVNEFSKTPPPLGEQKILGESEDGTYIASMCPWGASVGLVPKSGKIKYSKILPNTTLDTTTLKDAQYALNGKDLGKYKGKKIIAKHGQYGPYLSWNDKNKTFQDKDESIRTITFKKAVEWIESNNNNNNSEESGVLRTINQMYSVRYKKQSVYLMKRTPKGQASFASLNGYTVDDIDKINKLTVNDCKEIIDAKAKAPKYKKKEPTKKSVGSTSSVTKKALAKKAIAKKKK